MCLLAFIPNKAYPRRQKFMDKLKCREKVVKRGVARLDGFETGDLTEQLSLALAEISIGLALNEGWEWLLFVSVRFYLERMRACRFQGAGYPGGSS
jgi:hypothetical protein